MGQPGRKALHDQLAGIVAEHGIQFVVVNGENAAGGFGLTGRITETMLSHGVDVITSGNHIWRNKDVFKVIDKEPRLLRPVNYPPGTPGFGSGIFEKDGIRVGVINALGRVYMEAVDCPFRTVLETAQQLKEQRAQLLVVDFHAEATSEKTALAQYLDGTVSVVFGTHTHVQTSDARILPGGTGFITDVGMTGPLNSVIGVRSDRAISKFVSGLPAKFEVADGTVQINCAVCAMDPVTGSALEIYPVRKQVEHNGTA